jgi:UDP-N-acetylglucosamine 2-epimerase (non-hydrolysing)/GDP/UDP-N,N'-diacetylbacillosamine 2-epimerase (hydrolysing)
MLLAADSRTAAASSLGIGVLGFAGAFDRLRPDVVVVFGDRYEMFAAAQAAYVLGLPIAHIAGGDTTEGSFDEAFRHGMSKMAQLHFVTNEPAAARLRQLGENPAHIYMVGSTALDWLNAMQFADRAELERELGMRLRRKNLLVTFHPATLELERPAVQVGELLAALEALGSEFGLFFTAPNADPTSGEVVAALQAFVARRDNARLYASLGQRRYLSLMKEVDAVVGNSSSGLAEAPAVGTPTVNIGERQRGRPLAASVVSCPCRRGDIERAVRRVMEIDCSRVVNPYGERGASARIKERLKALPDAAALMKKRFFDLPQGRS